MDCLSFPFIRRVNQSFGSEPAQVPCYEFLRSLRLIASAAFGLTSYVEKCPTAGHFPSPPDAGRRRGTGRGGAFGLDSPLSNPARKVAGAPFGSGKECPMPLGIGTWSGGYQAQNSGTVEPA